MEIVSYDDHNLTRVKATYCIVQSQLQHNNNRSIGNVNWASIDIALFLLTAALAPSSAALPDLLLI
jgi:hypothetical protein